MPEILHVRVVETREVIVSANSLSDAIVIANAKFNNTEIPHGTECSIWGHTVGPVKQTDIRAELD